MKKLTLRLDGNEWWKDGLKFECQGSGKCCQSRGQYGFVFLDKADRKRMARHLGMSTSSFTKKYCSKTFDQWHLNEDAKNPDCLFLKDKNKCGVYEARPTQCRTWPFWPEVMNAKTWNKEVASFCPGIGKGKLYSREEIKSLLIQQIESEK
jgi:Fe-S-cluster containining protein